MTRLLLLAVFVGIPAAEIGLFVAVGSRIGIGTTLLIVLLTGVGGAALARAQGFSVMEQIRAALDRGELPARELLSGAFVLVGSALLLTPGFLTDVLGLLCLLPPTRALLQRGLGTLLTRRIARGERGFGFRFEAGPVHKRGPAEPLRPGDTLRPDGPRPNPQGPRTLDATYRLVPRDGEE